MFVKSLPSFIVHNHIVPYTYLPQSPRLMADILSYTETMGELFQQHPPRYNLPLLMRDIVTSYYWFYFEEFCDILSRHYRIEYHHVRLNQYIFRFLRMESARSFRILWGLMRPEERQVVMDRIHQEEKYYQAR